MKTADNNQQPIAVKAGCYEINITPETLSAIAELKSNVIYAGEAITEIYPLLFNVGQGVPIPENPAMAISLLGRLQYIKERIEDISRIDILKNGEPVRVEE